MADYNPYSTPARDYEFFYDKKITSRSPTPSPRGSAYMFGQGGNVPPRPLTRAHFRNPSNSSSGFPSPRGPSFSPRYTSDGTYATANAGVPIFTETGFSSPRFEPRERRNAVPVPGHTRRISASVPQRPQTARPSSSHAKRSSPEPKAGAATGADATRHNIPAGYSLKNWDPTEEPIMLLGSVFDANSLGKWIYDWTVYHHGPATPISEMAGELWLLLIQLAGKIKRADAASGPLKAGEIHTTEEIRRAMKDLDKLENRVKPRDRRHDKNPFPPDHLSLNDLTKHTSTSSQLHKALRRLIPPTWAINTLLFAALLTPVLAANPPNNPNSHVSPQDIIIQITAAISLSAGIVLPPLRSNDTQVSTNRIYWIAAYSVWGVSFLGLLLLELRLLKSWLQRRLLVGMVLFSGLNLLGSLAQGSLDGAAAWAPLSLTVSLVLVPVVIEYLGPREAARASMELVQ